MNSSKILKYLIITGVVALLITPFIVTPSLFFFMITGKAFYFRILTTLIFGAWLVLAILDPEYRPKNNLLSWAFLGFVIVLFISNLTGENRLASFWSNFERMEGWVTIVHLYMLFLAISNTFTKKIDWNILFNASAVASIYMVYEVYLQLQEKGWGYRTDATLGNSTYLGIYMLMNAFLILYLIVTHSEKITEKITSIKKKISKIMLSPINALYLLAFILNVLVVFQTNTRGAIVGLFGGLLVMGFIMVILSKGKLLQYSALGLIALTAIIAGSMFAFKDSDFVNNYAPLKRITTISMSEGSAKARILNWKIATEGFKERPILGWGQSNFSYAFDKYYLPEHYGNEARFDRVHNIIFDWLIAGGIVGLIAYLLLWFGFVWAILKTKKISSNQKGAILGLMAAYFIHNIFVFDQIVSYLYFIFMLGFAASLYGKEIKALQKDLSENMKFILLAGVLIFIPLAIYLVNVPNIQAGQNLVQATQLFKKNKEGQVLYFHKDGLKGNVEMLKKTLQKGYFSGPEAVQRAITMINEISQIRDIKGLEMNEEDFIEYVNFIRDESEFQITEDPTNSINYYLYGFFLQAISQNEEAEHYFLKAIEFAPNKQVLRIPLIGFYTKNKEGEKATALATETYELDKSIDEIWEIYIKTISIFDPERATTEIKEAVSDGQLGRVEKMLLANIQKSPENYQNYISLAALYLQVEQREKSLETLYEAKEKFPDIKTQLGKLIGEIEAGDNPLGKSF